MSADGVYEAAHVAKHAAEVFPDLPATFHRDHRAHAREQVRRRVRQSLPPFPELRFEQAYVRSVLPALSPRKGDDTAATAITLGHTVNVAWGQLSWITVREQVISPLVQGMFWGLLSVAGVAAKATLWPSRHP